MIIKTKAELEAMQEIGQICGIVLTKMSEALEPGISTQELDEIGHQVLRQYGARSAPIAMYRFPGYTCISVNDVVAHGIPSADVIIKEGDTVNIDVSAVKNGFYGDTAYTYMVGKVDKKKQEVCLAAQEALKNALKVAVAGNFLSEIGRAVEQTAHRHGFRVIKNLCGHGVGHTLHDKPDAINNYWEKRDRRVLTPGLVLAIEPFVSPKDEFVLDAESDGWTLRTRNRCCVAQYEHTVMVTEDEPVILTLRDDENEIFKK